MQIEHRQEENRFVIPLQQGEAELTYLWRGDDVLDLVHTYVPPESRNQGVGEALVEHAVSYAEARGLRIDPTCPFVRAWLEAHPEHRDVAVDPERI